MAAHTVTLRLPTPLFDHFRTRAERTQRSLEAEILEAVATVATDEEDLPSGVARILADLELLSDEELWRAARNRFPETERSRLEALNLKQQGQGLTASEKTQLEELVERYDLAVVLRAEAAKILKERGHAVSELLAAR